MPKFYKNYVCLLLLILLTGCETGHHLAPVSESRWHSYAKTPRNHKVCRGETLYAIAFRYDIDYRQLAILNNIKPPYALRIGQIVQIQGVKRTIFRNKKRHFSPYSQPRVLAKPKIIYSPIKNTPSLAGWVWPAKGQVHTVFLPAQGKKGIDIACIKGEKVLAAFSGVVAYAGSGLSGYGNLIIIKHNNDYLTAYGNNAHNLVREGQKVKAGQAIAVVGLVDKTYWGVHFEIRKKGQPVNPLNYLKKG